MMMLASHPLDFIGIADTGIVAVLGYALVFVGLIALMLVVIFVGKLFTSSQKKKEAAPEPAPAPVAVVPVDPNQEPAPGTAGQLKLYDTPPKTAAMVMAIVAHKLGKPLNELRFISIKEVK